MNLSLKKLSAITATLMLSLVGFGAISTPAHAADCPYPVEDQTANDHPKDVIRLISPVLTDDNSIHRYDFESKFTIDCDWFGLGLRFNQVYVPFGLTTNLTFHASTPAGAPLAFTKVTLRGNKGYSSSNAAVRINGVKARPAPSNASDGADVSGTTDVNGNVTFVVQSPADCTIYGGTLPAAPANASEDTANDRNADPTTDCYSQFLPQILGEKLDTADFVELHFFDSTGLDYSVDTATVDVVAPTLNETNSMVGEGVVQTYAQVGSKQTVVFQALKGDGSYARNHAVNIFINTGNSGANAKLSAGLIGSTGLATLTPADSTKTADNQLQLSGMTDAFGNVAFTIFNTDTSGEAPPATKITPVPTENAKFANFVVDLGSIATASRTVEVHYFKTAPILPTTITAVSKGRTITVTIKNAIGKTSTISITGKAKVTVKPTTASKVLTYTVKKGKITVKVVSNGKTLTQVFTIK
ncbi:MAG: hypothetical protein WCG32_03000 [Actinomycetes bacterium]